MDFDISLYLVTDSGCCSESEFFSCVEAACRSGVTLLQLREKNREGREYYELALKVKEISDRYNIPLIIDDRADVALAIDASGVHVGSADLPVAAVRKIIGPNKILGATAKTVDAARAAYEAGADYLGVGAIYPTTTKVKTVLTKVSTLNDICDAVPIPIVAIGGLNVDNADILRGAKMDGIAVVSAIMKSASPKEATIALRNKVRELKGF